jgi:elongator complex protein 5
MQITGKLIIIDSLNTLASTSLEPTNLPGLLSSFISPTTSLLGIYHTDIPTPSTSSQRNPYSPPPLTLLKYLATTIFTTHSLHHVLARKEARERSRIEPSFGLGEDIEGVVQGLGANGADGLVLEMEHRRKSGRGVREWYFLPLRTSTDSVATTTAFGKSRELVTLLEDHPQYAKTDESKGGVDGAGAETETTFELGLTEKQRLDREGVVLPYFDAQKGGGEGGRILYDMGSEDDFDEEEDEI